MANGKEQKPQDDVDTEGGDVSEDSDIVAHAENNDLWIFGFGSLIWKADFPSRRRVEGCIKGYRRVFFQGSTDHRGTPGAPGRTVTIEACEGGVVSGAAYLLSGTASEQQSTIKDLEHREKQYDVREYVPVFASGEDTEPIIEKALLYIASPNKSSNPNYLGPAPQEDIAQQIHQAHGESGPNSEYLHNLAEAARKMNVEDTHLEWLDGRVRELQQSQVH